MILHVVITNVVYLLAVRHKSVFLVTCIFFTSFISIFANKEMRYCSEDAPRTGERNVNLNKNTSENAV